MSSQTGPHERGVEMYSQDQPSYNSTKEQIYKRHCKKIHDKFKHIKWFCYPLHIFASISTTDWNLEKYASQQGIPLKYGRTATGSKIFCWPWQWYLTTIFCYSDKSICPRIANNVKKCGTLKLAWGVTVGRWSSSRISFCTTTISLNTWIVKNEKC